MSNELVIIGAGDNGREISWVVERVNTVRPTWTLLGFVDDDPETWGKTANGYPVLGPISWLKERTEETWFVCSIATGRIRKRVLEQMPSKQNLHPATLIDPAAVVAGNAQIAPGCLICAGNVVNVNVRLHDFVILNVNCTIGHDTVLENFCTVNPGTNISGKVHVKECVDIGTGSKIIQGKTIAENVVLGAGAVVVRDIEEPGTYVGVPARKLPSSTRSK